MQGSNVQEPMIVEAFETQNAGGDCGSAVPAGEEPLLGRGR